MIRREFVLASALAASIAAYGLSAQAQDIGTGVLHDFLRRDHVALGLGHLLALFVPNHRVQVNLVERNLIHEMDSHHDHAGDPEENDVGAGHQVGRRIKFRARCVIHRR